MAALKNEMYRAVQNCKEKKMANKKAIAVSSEDIGAIFQEQEILRSGSICVCNCSIAPVSPSVLDASGIL